MTGFPALGDGSGDAFVQREDLTGHGSPLRGRSASDRCERPCRSGRASRCGNRADRQRCAGSVRAAAAAGTHRRDPPRPPRGHPSRRDGGASADRRPCPSPPPDRTIRCALSLDHGAVITRGVAGSRTSARGDPRTRDPFAPHSRSPDSRCHLHRDVVGVVDPRRQTPQNRAMTSTARTSRGGIRRLAPLSPLPSSPLCWLPSRRRRSRTPRPR